MYIRMEIGTCYHFFTVLKKKPKNFQKVAVGNKNASTQNCLILSSQIFKNQTSLQTIKVTYS